MINRTTGLLHALATLSLLACDGPRAVPNVSPQPATPHSSAIAPVASASVSPAEPPLPPGMLAVIPSKTGVVRVEDSAAFRLLTIDDVVHAAHFKDSANVTLAPFDPLISLIKEARDEANGRALVLGLGSGATAAALASTGYAVEVAEIDPAVIDVARRFFNYHGHAEAIDGLDALRREAKPYELVLIDAFAGKDGALAFAKSDAVALVRRRLASPGLVAVRLLGSPRESRVLDVLRVFAGAFPHKRLYGTGVADEPQNLYLLLSDQPLHLFDLSIGPVFPLPWPDIAAVAAESSNEASRRDVLLGKQPRRAALVGYLVRGEDGSLCIDLPHWKWERAGTFYGAKRLNRFKSFYLQNSIFPPEAT
jgi:spermidine synthase